jgi:hypothetical protein
MSYPQGAPGGPGYPPAQHSTNQFAAPTQQFNRVPEAGPAPDGASKLPVYLSGAVAALGLLIYLAGFAPQFTISASDFPGMGQLSGSSLGLLFAVIAAVLAGLLAGLSLLPKQPDYTAIAAVGAVLGFLLVIAEVIKKPTGATIDWGLYLVIAFTLLQAAVAVVVVLFKAGVITAPAPRPRYEQPQHFGQYPGAYYGQPQGQHQGQPQQQGRPGYPTPYGGYPSTGPSTGGFPAGGPSGPPTPPTGFPTYGQPPASNAPTTQVPAQHQSSSSQSDQSSS